MNHQVLAPEIQQQYRMCFYVDMIDNMCNENNAKRSKKRKKENIEPQATSLARPSDHIPVSGDKKMRYTIRISRAAMRRRRKREAKKKRLNQDKLVVSSKSSKCNVPSVIEVLEQGKISKEPIHVNQRSPWSKTREDGQVISSNFSEQNFPSVNADLELQFGKENGMEGNLVATDDKKCQENIQQVIQENDSYCDTHHDVRDDQSGGSDVSQSSNPQKVVNQVRPFKQVLKDITNSFNGNWSEVNGTVEGKVVSRIKEEDVNSVDSCSMEQLNVHEERAIELSKDKFGNDGGTEDQTEFWENNQQLNCDQNPSHSLNYFSTDMKKSQSATSSYQQVRTDQNQQTSNNCVNVSSDQEQIIEQNQQILNSYRNTEVGENPLDLSHNQQSTIDQNQQSSYSYINSNVSEPLPEPSGDLDQQLWTGYINTSIPKPSADASFNQQPKIDQNQQLSSNNIKTHVPKQQPGASINQQPRTDQNEQPSSSYVSSAVHKFTPTLQPGKSLDQQPRIDQNQNFSYSYFNTNVSGPVPDPSRYPDTRNNGNQQPRTSYIYAFIPIPSPAASFTQQSKIDQNEQPSSSSVSSAVPELTPKLRLGMSFYQQPRSDQNKSTVSSNTNVPVSGTNLSTFQQPRFDQIQQTKTNFIDTVVPVHGPGSLSCHQLSIGRYQQTPKSYSNPDVQTPRSVQLFDHQNQEPCSNGKVGSIVPQPGLSTLQQPKFIENQQPANNFRNTDMPKVRSGPLSNLQLDQNQQSTYSYFNKNIPRTPPGFSSHLETKINQNQQLLTSYIKTDVPVTEGASSSYPQARINQNQQVLHNYGDINNPGLRISSPSYLDQGINGNQQLSTTDFPISGSYSPAPFQQSRSDQNQQPLSSYYSAGLQNFGTGALWNWRSRIIQPSYSYINTGVPVSKPDMLFKQQLRSDQNQQPSNNYMSSAVPKPPSCYLRFGIDQNQHLFNGYGNINVPKVPPGPYSYLDPRIYENQQPLTSYVNSNISISGPGSSASFQQHKPDQHGQLSKSYSNTEALEPRLGSSHPGINQNHQLLSSYMETDVPVSRSGLSTFQQPKFNQNHQPTNNYSNTARPVTQLKITQNQQPSTSHINTVSGTNLSTLQQPKFDQNQPTWTSFIGTNVPVPGPGSLSCHLGRYQQFPRTNITPDVVKPRPDQLFDHQNQEPSHSYGNMASMEPQPGPLSLQQPKLNQNQQPANNYSNTARPGPLSNPQFAQNQQSSYGYFNVNVTEPRPSHTTMNQTQQSLTKYSNKNVSAPKPRSSSPQQTKFNQNQQPSNNYQANVDIKVLGLEPAGPSFHQEPKMNQNQETLTSFSDTGFSVPGPGLLSFQQTRSDRNQQSPKCWFNPDTLQTF